MENINNLNVQATEAQVNKAEWAAPKCVVLNVGGTMTRPGAGPDGGGVLNNAS